MDIKPIRTLADNESPDPVDAIAFRMEQQRLV
jgi:hypothetical protein